MSKPILPALFLLSLLPFTAQASIKCKNMRTNVIVDVAGYTCPTGYLRHRDGSSGQGGLLNRIGAFDRYKTQPGETMSPFAKQFQQNYGGLVGQQPQQQQNPAVQAKLQQIKEIDALYNSGSISKAQADSLKRSVLGN